MISGTVLTVDDHLDDDGCPAPVTFKESIGITLFLAWLFFLTFIGRIIFAPLLPAIEQEFGLSHSQAGSIFLMLSLGLFIAPVCSGIISFKINHRGALFVSSLAMALGLILLGFIDSLLIIRLVMIILGLAAGLHLPSAMATITAEVQRPDWGKALGVHQSAPPLAFVSAPLIAAALMGWLSWRTIVVLVGVLSILSVMAYKGFGRGGAFPGRIPNFSIMKTILTKSSFWIMILLFSMAMGGTIGIYTMLPLFLVTERGMDLTWANTFLWFLWPAGSQTMSARREPWRSFYWLGESSPYCSVSFTVDGSWSRYLYSLHFLLPFSPALLRPCLELPPQICAVSQTRSAHPPLFYWEADSFLRLWDIWARPIPLDSALLWSGAICSQGPY